VLFRDRSGDQTRDHNEDRHPVQPGQLEETQFGVLGKAAGPDQLRPALRDIRVPLPVQQPDDIEWDQPDRRTQRVMTAPTGRPDQLLPEEGPVVNRVPPPRHGPIGPEVRPVPSPVNGPTTIVRHPIQNTANGPALVGSRSTQARTGAESSWEQPPGSSGIPR